MKVTFSVAHLYDNKYSVKYNVAIVGGKTLELSSVATYNGFKLTEMLGHCKNVIYSRLCSLRKAGQEIPPARNIELEWDGNVLKLQKSMQTQASSAQRRYSAPLELLLVEPQELPLLEVRTVNEVWTVVPHDQPYLTWAEACNLLKEKVMK